MRFSENGLSGLKTPRQPHVVERPLARKISYFNDLAMCGALGGNQSRYSTIDFVALFASWGAVCVTDCSPLCITVLLTSLDRFKINEGRLHLRGHRFKAVDLVGPELSVSDRQWACTSTGLSSAISPTNLNGRRAATRER